MRSDGNIDRTVGQTTDRFIDLFGTGKAAQYADSYRKVTDALHKILIVLLCQYCCRRQ